MENFYLMDLINAVNGSFVIGNPHLPIHDIGIDTRTIKEGSLLFFMYYAGDKIQEYLQKRANDKYKKFFVFL